MELEQRYYIKIKTSLNMTICANMSTLDILVVNKNEWKNNDRIENLTFVTEEAAWRFVESLTKGIYKFDPNDLKVVEKYIREYNESTKPLKEKMEDFKDHFEVKKLHEDSSFIYVHGYGICFDSILDKQKYTIGCNKKVYPYMDIKCPLFRTYKEANDFCKYDSLKEIMLHHVPYMNVTITEFKYTLDTKIIIVNDECKVIKHRYDQ